ncbi:MAG: putative zinc-binding metallopeptidase [Thalassobaculum sp.]
MSSYATAHPWEDFAESWARYLHIVDTLETAQAFGMTIRARAGTDPVLSMEIESTLTGQPISIRWSKPGCR